MLPPTPSQALFWALFFVGNGCIVGLLLVPFIVAARRGQVTYMSAFTVGIFIALIGWMPGRIIQSYVQYGVIFRESYWVVLWILVYSVTTAGVLRHVAKRIEPPSR